MLIVRTNAWASRDISRTLRAGAIEKQCKSTAFL